MTTIRDFIAQMIQQRKQRLPQLEEKDSALRKLDDLVGRLRQAAEQDMPLHHTPEKFRDALRHLQTSLSDLSDRSGRLSEKLGNTIKRFKKDTINIGVAGRMRQGKSTLLQNLTGLTDNNVIPAGEGSTVTGTKSIIYHALTQSAEVEYFTEQDFLAEKVWPYYDKLELTPRPRALREFSEKPLPPKPAITADTMMYGELEKLHNALPHFVAKLGNRPEAIAIDAVPQYVSQQCGEMYMAVRCVRIRTPFPNQDVSGLGLVDLPGLGEIAAGFEQKLIESLKTEVDMVVLIRMPNPADKWQEKDLDLIKLIETTVPDITLSQWLMVVLNQRDDNAKALQAMMGSRPKNLEFLQADARNPKDVQNKVFAPALSYLQGKLEEIDKQILARLAEEELALQQTMDEAARRVKETLVFTDRDSADRKQFNKLFRQFFDQLKLGLENLKHEYRQQATQMPAEDMQRFRAANDSLCNKAEDYMKKRVPSEAQLPADIKVAPGPSTVFEKLLTELRVVCTKQLCTLDMRHGEAKEAMLNKLVAAIMPSPLRSLICDEATGKADATLAAVCKLCLVNAPHLAEAIEMALSHEYSYLSHIHYRIRAQLNLLDPKASDSVDKLRAAWQAGGENAAKDAREGLCRFVEETVYHVRKLLTDDEFVLDQYKALFALVEEITDRLIREADIEVEWDTLVYAQRARIWPKEFSVIAANSQRTQDWHSMLDEACNLAHIIAL